MVSSVPVVFAPPASSKKSKAPARRGGGAGDGSDGEDDIACVICRRKSSSASNPILLCDAKNCAAASGLGAAHLRCIGLAAVPGEEWLCTVCRPPMVRTARPASPEALYAPALLLCDALSGLRGSRSLPALAGSPASAWEASVEPALRRVLLLGLREGSALYEASAAIIKSRAAQLCLGGAAIGDAAPSHAAAFAARTAAAAAAAPLQSDEVIAVNKLLLQVSLGEVADALLRLHGQRAARPGCIIALPSFIMTECSLWCHRLCAGAWGSVDETSQGCVILSPSTVHTYDIHHQSPTTATCLGVPLTHSPRSTPSGHGRPTVPVSPVAA